ncbi:MerR family transcriptional regulator [uncultured Clostridium sp.]|uniref:MerR family transcriptional regulator n=1 Tax=uncultured Clostridium sp. TaxID=59620 RepID=UPI0028E28D5A|nr:MerR family transcriptional regulator [uncultured Clostridium sp.]
MDEELLPIGKFSKICSISIQALRHYDKIGILKPKFTDIETGYRFYSVEQIIIIMVIKKMSALGLSLSEIGELLHRNDMAGVKAIFQQKREEIKEKINELLYADKSLKLYIDDINMCENADFAGIEIKKVPMRNIIYLKKTIELNENGFTKLFNEFEKIIGTKKYLTIGNPMAIYHGERILGNPCDVELCLKIKEVYASEENCKVIQEVHYLSKMHLGAHTNYDHKKYYVN